MRNTQKPGKHKSVHRDLNGAIGFLRSLIEVDRVIMGTSRSIRHGGRPGHLKALGSQLAGLRVLGYSDQGVSEFFVVTKHPESVTEMISQRFG